MAITDKTFDDAEAGGAAAFEYLEDWLLKDCAEEDMGVALAIALAQMVHEYLKDFQTDAERDGGLKIFNMQLAYKYLPWRLMRLSGVRDMPSLGDTFDMFQEADETIMSLKERLEPKFENDDLGALMTVVACITLLLLSRLSEPDAEDFAKIFNPTATKHLSWRLVRTS